MLVHYACDALTRGAGDLTAALTGHDSPAGAWVRREVLDARLGSGGGSSDDDLAERLGMRLNTFLQNFTRARKLLADCLREHGIDIGAGGSQNGWFNRR